MPAAGVVLVTLVGVVVYATKQEEPVVGGFGFDVSSRHLVSVAIAATEETDL